MRAAVVYVALLLLLTGCATQRPSTPPSSPPIPTEDADRVATRETFDLHATAPTGVGSDDPVFGQSVNGLSPDPTKFVLKANATSLRVTATWTSTPAGDVFYLSVHNVDERQRVGNTRGKSPLVLEVVGPLHAGNYDVIAWPDSGRASNGEDILLHFEIEYAT